MTRIERDVERAVDSLQRIVEFRLWLETNVLFPTVPDAIVHPLVDRLREAEIKLVELLYYHRQFDKVVTIHKMLTVA